MPFRGLEQRMWGIATCLPGFPFLPSSALLRMREGWATLLGKPENLLALWLWKETLEAALTVPNDTTQDRTGQASERYCCQVRANYAMSSIGALQGDGSGKSVGCPES